MNNYILLLFTITETPDGRFAITHNGRLIGTRESREQAERTAAYWEMRNSGLNYAQAIEALKEVQTL